ncbi:MAG: hypothetical protein ACRD2O_09540, partial [Terriglobia bacterium]
IEAAKNEGLEILAVLSLVDREEGGSETIRKTYPYFPVFTAKELLEDSSEGPGVDTDTTKDTQAPLKLDRRSA